MPVGKFSFYRSFRDAAMQLSDADRLRLYDAMCEYAFDGVYPDFDGVMGIVWTLVQPNIDSSVKGQLTGGVRKGKGPSKADAEAPSEAPSEGGVEGVGKDGGKLSETPEEAPSEGPLGREMIKKRMGIREERKGDVRAGGSIEPSGPSQHGALCPLCESPCFKQAGTGRYECSSCHDTWTAGQVTWR